KMNKKILTYTTEETGIEKFTLDLNALYENKNDRQRFEQKWDLFYKLDERNAKVFKKTKDKLIYLSESWIPTKLDNRPPVLLLFGNPAPHSVSARMYFAYEGKGREHRIWRIFRGISLLAWNNPFSVVGDTLFNNNQTPRERFYDLDYNSPFRLAMAVYFSIPSHPSDPIWSGVGGLHRLFGEKAIGLIEKEEKKRVHQIISQFMPKDGGIIVFQKDAYNGIKKKNSPNYSLKETINGSIEANYWFNPKIKIFGVPPTRFLQGKKAKKSLENSINELKKYFVRIVHLDKVNK
ncbi:MAG: hypothetical protein Q8N98_01810, partial [bacterium]|nr:hypothetical protein [bacterium]